MVDKFSDGTQEKWKELGFSYTAAWEMTQEQRDELFKLINEVGGDHIGNIDFALSNSIEDVERMTERTKSKCALAIVEFRKKVGV